MSSGQKSQSQQQSSGTSVNMNTVNPFQFGQYQANYGNARNIASGLTTPYSGPLTAPFTPAQIQAQNLLAGVATDPKYQAMIGNAAGAVGGILSNPVATNVTAQPVTAGTVANSDLTPYLNPYQSNVVNATLSQLNQLNANHLMNTNQSATAAHAFGGSRSGVADALTNAYDMQTAAPILAQLNAQGFANAQSLAGQDAATLNNVAQFNAGQSMNAQQSSINNALAAQGLGLDAANALASLANQGYGLAAGQGGLLGSVGQTQQAHDQSALTTAYNAWLAQQTQNLQAQNLLNASLGLIPVEQTSNSSTSGNSTGTTQSSNSPGLLDIMNSMAALLHGR